ncbi:hypothetical protein DY000_02005323 [Brassica cretica]|uniref:Uncharacterized protein n=1 Tax=Brassica cretica TaxID=69181 RepID=A0ABQ7C8C1_BRACR|nr:hypothetical protein DY000_02005323 [Brassica cretica]
MLDVVDASVSLGLEESHRLGCGLKGVTDLAVSLSPKALEIQKPFTFASGVRAARLSACRHRRVFSSQPRLLFASPVFSCSPRFVSVSGFDFRCWPLSSAGKDWRLRWWFSFLWRRDTVLWCGSCWRSRLLGLMVSTFPFSQARRCSVVVRRLRGFLSRLGLAVVRCCGSIAPCSFS